MIEDSFLYRVAEEEWSKYSDQWRERVYVFPNRRSALFFRKYMAQCAGKPIFAPKTITINQLFSEHSKLTAADPVSLLFDTYEVYKDKYLQPNHFSETFDEFVFWGRMLISDFNEVDANLVSAEQLFVNLSDLKEIEERFPTPRTPWQETELSSLQQFAEGFAEHADNKLRRHFLSIWQCLLPIYNELGKRLREKGEAYMGMMCRDVVEHFAAEDYKHCVFVGFNVLNGVERRLMHLLQDNGKTTFYWDYAPPYLCDSHNRASLFMKQNLQEFPSDFSVIGSGGKAEIHWLQTSSTATEARCAAQIISEMGELGADQWTRVGIVMPDEQLLPMVIDSLPGNISHVNITMGQSLRSTPVYSLIQHLSRLNMLQKRDSKSETLFYYDTVFSLLYHPYINCVVDKDRLNEQISLIRNHNMLYVRKQLFDDEPILKQLFETGEASANLPQLLSQLLRQLIDTETDKPDEKNECIYQVLLVLQRLERLLLKHADIAFQPRTFYQILLNLLDTVSIPFEGEPLVGLQIMGVLESRGMDFERLIITDVNDDVLPGSPMQNTYIPYDLRRAYQLPTPERQDAVYAYNFFRLISRAKQVWLLQNSASNNQRTGEPSRYIYQLIYQYNSQIEPEVISNRVEQTGNKPIQITKTPAVMEQIKKVLMPDSLQQHNVGLAPSALNVYVSCPARFYWEHILKLREDSEISRQIDSAQLGTILHATLQQMYDKTQFVNKSKIDDFLLRLNNTNLIEQLYRQYFLKDADLPLTGNDYLPMQVVKEYATRVLKHDAGLPPFNYVASEVRCKAYFTLSDGRKVMLKGVIDRIDQLRGETRVIDYKTGGEHSKTNFSLKELYNDEVAKDADYTRQTLFYCWLIDNSEEGRRLTRRQQTEGGQQTTNSDLYPFIYYVRLSDDKFCQEVVFKNKDRGYDAIRNDFEEALNNVLTEILDPKVAFSNRPQRGYSSHCKTCPFAEVCL